MTASDTPGKAPEFSRPVAVDDLLEADTMTGEAEEEERGALSTRFGLLSLDSLTYAIRARPWRGGVRLTGTVRAQAQQACVVTLTPVQTTISEDISRGFIPRAHLPDYEPNAEYELADDPEIGDAPEPLDEMIDLGEIAAETLALALPVWPRAADAALEKTTAAPPGADPIREADIKPFAALAALRKNSDEDEKKD